MRSDPDDQIEVAWGATAGTSATLPSKPDALPVDYARRDIHIKRALPVWTCDGEAALGAVVGLLKRDFRLELLVRARNWPPVGTATSEDSTE